MSLTRLEVGIGVAVVVMVGAILLTVNATVDAVGRAADARRVEVRAACRALYAKARTAADSLVVAKTKVSWDAAMCIEYPDSGASVPHREDAPQ